MPHSSTRYRFVSACCALACSLHAYAGILWVAPSGSDSSGNGTELSPYATLGRGVQVAANGDSVVAKSGIYSGTGNRSINFGGKTITVRSERGPFETTIDCGGQKAFTAVSGETSATTVEGFKIINGNVSSNQDWGGDGIIRMWDNGVTDSALTVRNCIFTANTVTATYVTTTAGIIIKNGSTKKAIVENCLFYGNTLNGGGWVGSSGGGAGVICFPAINHGAYDLTNCTIANNILTGSGKIIPCNIVAGNITNCITWGNSAPHYPFSISNDKATIVNDTGTNSYSMATGGVLVNIGSGVLVDQDPLFTNAASGDYSLSAASPAANAGDPSSVLNKNGTRADIGFRPTMVGAAPRLSNITAAQRAGTKLVDISYDVASTSVSQVKISLQVSSDGGITFTVPVATVTGNVGTGIAIGTNKTMTWNAGVDWNLQTSSQMHFRLTAEESPVSGFALIPGGTFSMGDAVDGDTNAPVHSVSISTFYMQTTETPRSLWNSVRSSAASLGYSDLATGDSKSGGTLDHPVYSVSWYDAVKWCNARSEEEGLTPCYYTSNALTTVYRTGSLNLASDAVNWDANGYRLPTEAEWEKAARGGVSAKRYPWGTNTISYAEANFYSTYANGSYGDQSGGAGYNPTYAVGGERYTAPVGDFFANGLGLHQMAGNVWEWCWDAYSATYYSEGPVTDPTGPTPVINRVQRGAGLDRPEWCRVSHRGAWSANTPNINLGFRTVRSGAVVRNSDVQLVSAAVTVNTNGPLITTHPQPQTIYETYPVTFSVAATGTGTLRYQWRRGGNDLPAETNSSLTLASAIFADAVNYDVLVTDDTGTTPSNAVALTVISRAPNATITPTSPVVNPNSAVTFTANVVTGIAPFTYQWRKNGAKIAGAKASSYTIASAQQSHEGSYDCVVTNAFGSATAPAASLSVNDPVVIVVPPLTQAANVGDEVTLHVTASGTATLSYQWRRNNAPISGETDPDLTFTATALSGGVYDVVVTNVVGSVTSLPATLTLLAPPVITADPVDQTVAASATANFSVTATGDGLTYQWRRNGLALTGKTSATLALPNVQAANVGYYDVVVKNAFGTVLSASALLTVNSPLMITTDPQDVNAVIGDTVSFSVTATGPGVLTYQWAKDGVALSGASAKTATLSVPVTSASVAGVYQVTVTSGTLKATSFKALLTVGDDRLLIYKLTATGTISQDIINSSTAITGTMILDRANQRGAFIWFGKNGAVNTFSTEMREDLRTHAAGPVPKSHTVISRVATSGTAPDESQDLMWLRGANSLLTISTTDKTVGPLTLSGSLNILDLNGTLLAKTLTLTATLDAASSAQSRQAGETVERALNRLAAGWQLKGYVKE